MSASRCPGYARHWFAPKGGVYVRSPICVRCGARNPKELTTDDWQQILDYWPELAGTDPYALAAKLEDTHGIKFPVDKFGKLTADPGQNKP